MSAGPGADEMLKSTLHSVQFSGCRMFGLRRQNTMFLAYYRQTAERNGSATRPSRSRDGQITQARSGRVSVRVKHICRAFSTCTVDESSKEVVVEPQQPYIACGDVGLSPNKVNGRPGCGAEPHISP